MNPAPPARPRSTPTAGTHKNKLAQKQPKAKPHPAAIASSTACAPTNTSLLDEDSEEFLLLVHDHLDRFRPVGPAEEKLVLRIANDQWRLDRAFPFEAGIYRDRFHDVAAKEELRQQQYTSKKGYAEEDGEPVPPPPTPPDEGDLLARAFNVDCEGPNSFVKLARYEGSIERSIDRCLRQLEKYQAARNAITPGPGRQPSPPPDEPRDPETATRNAPARAAAPSKNKNYHSNPKKWGCRPSRGTRWVRRHIPDTPCDARPPACRTRTHRGARIAAN
jgi:hypothetical protein